MSNRDRAVVLSGVQFEAVNRAVNVLSWLLGELERAGGWQIFQDLDGDTVGPEALEAWNYVHAAALDAVCGGRFLDEVRP